MAVNRKCWIAWAARAQGPELIYTADDGRLQSNGSVSDPAKSVILRRHKK